MNKHIFTGILIAIILVGSVFFFTQQSKAPASSATEGKMVAGYSGKVLAGTTTKYVAFTQKDYDIALAEDKIIFLDFYANWCPICREEAPEIMAGFDALSTDAIVGFRVNYNDNETDADEKKLAKDLGVTYQHTKVFLKNGKEVSRSQDKWDKATFLKEANAVIQ